MKLYIGCSLTQAPKEFREQVEKVKESLRGKYELLDFKGLVEGTPHDVYLWDIHTCVETCDVFVAICDYPAIGVGYELGTAVEKLHKPTIALAQKDSLVSRLILGIEQPHYRFVRYNTVEEIPLLVRSFIADLSR